jgi:hypothetical protein
MRMTFLAPTGTGSGILVLHLSRVEIHRSARRHKVPDDDIAHAYEHAVAWAELGDDPPRYLIAGADRAGNLLELVVVDVEGEVFVIHATRLRRSTQRELFGEEES